MSGPSIAVLRQRANWAHKALLQAACNGEDCRAALHREAGRRAEAKIPVWLDTLKRWGAISPDGAITDIGRAILGGQAVMTVQAMRERRQQQLNRCRTSRDGTGDERYGEIE